MSDTLCQSQNCPNIIPRAHCLQLLRSLLLAR